MGRNRGVRAFIANDVVPRVSAGLMRCNGVGVLVRSLPVQNKTVVPVRRSALIRKIGAVQRDIQG